MILKCICYTIILLFHYSYSNDNLPNWHNNSGIIQESKSLILTASLRTNSKIRLSLFCTNDCAGNILYISTFIRRCHCANDFTQLKASKIDLFDKPYKCIINGQCDHSITFSQVNGYQSLCDKYVDASEFQHEPVKIKLNDNELKVFTADRFGNVTERHVEYERHKQIEKNIIGNIWEDGFYIIGLQITGCKSVMFDTSMYITGHYLFLNGILFYKLYRLLSIVYGIFTFLWIFLSWRHWKQLRQIHYLIGAVVVMCFLYFFILFAIYSRFEKYGQSGNHWFIFTLLVESSSQAITWMILILISYGYSIVKPRLRSIHRKTCTFSIIYFVIYFCERVHATSRDYGFLGHLVILIPIAVLNAMAASWIIFNLFSILTNLAKKRKQAELTLYRQFSFSLTVISSVAFLSWVFVILFYRTAKCIKNTNQSLYEFSIRCGFIASIHVILAILWSPGAKNTSSIDDIALNSYVNDDTQDFNELNDSLAASDHFKSSKHESNEPSSADSSSQFSKDINFEQKADRLLRQLDKIS